MKSTCVGHTIQYIQYTNSDYWYTGLKLNENICILVTLASLNMETRIPENSFKNNIRNFIIKKTEKRFSIKDIFNKKYYPLEVNDCEILKSVLFKKNIKRDWRMYVQNLKTDVYCCSNWLLGNITFVKNSIEIH